MKCPEFNSIARELARHQLIGELCDADLRAQAAAHAAACMPCAARLADERSLTAGLRALALQDEPLAAPAQVETALLAALRQPAPVSVSAPKVVPLRPRAPRGVWAAAAVLLIGLFALALLWLLPGSNHANDAHVVRVVPAAPAVSPAPNLLAPRLPDAPVTTDRNAPPKHVSAAHKHQRTRVRIERYLVESEIATDFLPLADTSGLTQPEGFQIIRVQMTRMALASFGLPMSFERANEPVQAELVVGSDGLTRAIRFVQTSFEPEQIISANSPPSSKER